MYLCTGTNPEGGSCCLGDVCVCVCVALIFFVHHAQEKYRVCCV